MSISHLYDDFGGGEFINAEATGDMSQDGLEDIRLTAFEKGYQAGWDDATNAHETDQDRIGAELAQSLQDMSFTYHEAFSKLAASMQPLMTKIVTSVLPKVAQNTLAIHVMTEIAGLMAGASEDGMEITVAPENLPAMEQLATGETTLPFTIIADAALTSGQVYIRAAKIEREIDLDAIQASIASAVDAFFEQTQEEMNHG